MLGGFLFPVAALPGWLEAVARVVPLGWACDAMVGAATGWSASRVLAWLGVAVTLSAAWAALAVALFARVERQFLDTGGMAT